MIEDDDLDEDSIQDSDDNLPEGILDDSFDEESGDGDNRSLIEKATDKYDEIKDIKDKVEKTKEWVNKKKTADNTKKAADAAKKTKDTVDNTKKIADTTKNTKKIADTAKNTKKVADATKHAANTAKTTAKTAKGVAQSVKNIATTVKAIGKGIASAAKGVAAAVKAFIASVVAYWYIYLIILVVILIIIIAVAIALALAALLDWKTNPDNMQNNSYITSEHFYGARSVYIDEVDLVNAMELNYKQFSIELIENIKLDNPEITINIQLPELAEGQKLTNDIDLDDTIDQYMIKAMASIAATGGTAYADAEFIDLYYLIDYFGLTQEQLTKTKNYFANYFESNNVISGDGIDMNSIIENAFIVDVDGEHDLNYITNLCEKVMIKDEIASKEGLTDVKQRSYIASIYMPNHDISITHAVYTINGRSGTFSKYFQLIEENGPNKIIHAEQTLNGSINIVTGIDLGNAKINKFTSINENNVSAYSSGVSLFEAVKQTPKGLQYFKQTEKTVDGRTERIYTWKPSCDSLFYITFGNNPYEPDKEMSNNKFIFTEFDFWVSAQ